jgi:hypothetical protein
MLCGLELLLLQGSELLNQEKHLLDLLGVELLLQDVRLQQSVQLLGLLLGLQLLEQQFQLLPLQEVHSLLSRDETTLPRAGPMLAAAVLRPCLPCRQDERQRDENHGRNEVFPDAQHDVSSEVREPPENQDLGVLSLLERPVANGQHDVVAPRLWTKGICDPNKRGLGPTRVVFLSPHSSYLRSLHSAKFCATQSWPGPSRRSHSRSQTRTLFRTRTIKMRNFIG